MVEEPSENHPSGTFLWSPSKAAALRGAKRRPSVYPTFDLMPFVGVFSAAYTPRTETVAKVPSKFKEPYPVGSNRVSATNFNEPPAASGVQVVKITFTSEAT
jgi:hypothetical protein